MLPKKVFYTTNSQSNLGFFTDAVRQVGYALVVTNEKIKINSDGQIPLDLNWL